MNIRKKAVAAGMGGLLAISLAACAGSHVQPSLGQYGITTGHGNLSSQQVQNVAAPGSDVHLGSGTTTWYVYSDVRNYVTGPNGDREQSTQELTGSSKNDPAIPVYVNSYVPFELNPAILSKAGNWSFATQFLSFCLKYACATQTPQNDASNASLTRSSSPGWENMLNEIMPVAIDNATRSVINQYPPTVWTDQASWVGLGDKIGAQLISQLDTLDGASSSAPFFCGVGSTETKCNPLTMVVNKISPASSAVQNAYSQGNAAVYQDQAAQARLRAAEILYGKDANWVLGIEDIENQCPTKCTIYVGNAPVNPGS
jgi:hypothetical protein